MIGWNPGFGRHVAEHRGLLLIGSAHFSPPINHAPFDWAMRTGFFRKLLALNISGPEEAALGSSIS